MKILSFIAALAVASVELCGAAVVPPSENEVCLCLGKSHCFVINGVIEDDNLVTSLTKDVNIHLPLSAFTVESLDTCATRQKRGTDVDVHTSDHGAGIGVDHHSGNTHVHGSVDVDKHGHVSGTGSLSHHYHTDNTDAHGSVNVDTHGHVSGSLGVDHHSGNVHTSAGVDVDEKGHVSGHVNVGISFGRK